jgi:hypothetical protein
MNWIDLVKAAAKPLLHPCMRIIVEANESVARNTDVCMMKKRKKMKAKIVGGPLEEEL